jgi:hypothetical protein
LRPLRLFKKVLLIVTLVADERVAGNVRAFRLGRETKLTFLTAVNRPIFRDDKRVNASKWKVPLIWLIVELLKEVMRVALLMVKSPPIVEGPSSVISPVAPEPMTMLPETVEQLV